MSGLRSATRGLAVSFAGAAIVFSATPAHADVGSGVSANPIALSIAARAGKTYGLPPLRVVNTGTEPSSYHVSVATLASQRGGRSIPPAWIRVGQQDFVLLPQQWASVPLTLRLPRSAHGGDYLSGIRASATRTAGGQLVFGAAAATKLTFRVEGAPSLLGRFAGSTASKGALAVAGAALLLLLTARLFGVRVEIARRSPIVDGVAAIERGRTAIADLELRRQRLDGLARRARSVRGWEYIATSVGL